MNKQDRESEKNRTTSRARVEEIRAISKKALVDSEYRADVEFLLGIIDKQDKEKEEGWVKVVTKDSMVRAQTDESDALGVEEWDE